MSNSSPSDVITILLVDDTAETRENVKKLLSFEPDFKVIGSVGTGTQGISMARELKPNIVIMDINMPDIDGITATSRITESVPTCAVIMLSVQGDTDYMRKAMLAGARNFLNKPVAPDLLYSTIRTVHQQHKAIAERFTNAAAAVAAQPNEARKAAAAASGVSSRAGHVIVVYSPQGGVGTTTIASNLASGLMKESIRVLLVDADLQFGDIGAFLNLQSQTTMVDLAEHIEDLDTDFFDSVVASHESGLKVLLGPQRPEQAEGLRQKPTAVSQIVDKIRNNYDYTVVDIGNALDDSALSLFDIADRVVLVATPMLPAIKNIRFVLDVFDQLQYTNEKVVFVLNRVPTDRNIQRFTISSEKIERFLKRPIDVSIPVDEITVLSALSKGVPLVAQRDRSKSPIKEFMQLSDIIHQQLMPQDSASPAEETSDKNKSWTGFNLRFGKS